MIYLFKNISMSTLIIFMLLSYKPTVSVKHETYNNIKYIPKTSQTTPCDTNISQETVDYSIDEEAVSIEEVEKEKSDEQKAMDIAKADWRRR